MRVGELKWLATVTCFADLLQFLILQFEPHEPFVHQMGSHFALYMQLHISLGYLLLTAYITEHTWHNRQGQLLMRCSRSVDHSSENCSAQTFG